MGRKTRGKTAKRKIPSSKVEIFAHLQTMWGHEPQYIFCCNKGTLLIGTPADRPLGESIDALVYAAKHLDEPTPDDCCPVPINDYEYLGRIPKWAAIAMSLGLDP